MENEKELKRIYAFQGFMNVALIMTGVAAGFMIFIGFMDRSIYLAIGLIVVSVEVIIYYSIAIYCDMAMNIARIRGDIAKTALNIEKITSGTHRQ